MTGIERLRKLASKHRIIERYLTADAIDSIADQIERELREAETWVREHGGLDAVKEEWKLRSNLKRTCEKLRTKVERQQRHIEFVQGKCHERQGHIVDLNRMVDEMRPRIMPEDYEWPRYTSDELVEVGDDVVGPDYGERIHVDAVKFHANGFTLCDKNGFDTCYESDERFKPPAVLAADGEPLEVGQTVWDENGDELVIVALEDGGHTVTCRYVDVGDAVPVHGMWSPSDLTHTKPEIDTWERIEEDAENVAKLFDNFDADASEDIRAIVRRCRALAERERGD